MIRLDMSMASKIPIRYDAELAKQNKFIHAKMSEGIFGGEVPPERSIEDAVVDNDNIPGGIFITGFGKDEYYNKNEVGHDFFNRSTDFLYARAQRIAKEGVNWDRFFASDAFMLANRALDFFGGHKYEWKEEPYGDMVSAIRIWNHTSEEETNALMAQITAAVEEWGSLIASGKDADINSLTTKLNVKGSEMTLGDLVNMQKGLKAATDSLGYGISSYSDCAKRGLALAEINRFTQKELSPELADKVYSFMEDRMWADIDRLEKGSKNPVSSTNVDVYYFSTALVRGSMKGDILNKFAQIDGSSEESFAKGFKEAMDWYKDKRMEWSYATNYRHEWTKEALKREEAELRSMFSQMGHIKSINVLA